VAKSPQIPQARRIPAETWFDRGGSEGDLTELDAANSPQMLRRWSRSATSGWTRTAVLRRMARPTG